MAQIFARGLRPLIKKLGNFDKPLDRQVMRQVGEWMIEELRTGFDRGVDPYGKPWAPNAPSTVKKKGHSRVLFGADGGSSIRDSLKMDLGQRGALGVHYDSPLASFHHRAKRIPRRLLLPTSEGGGIRLPQHWSDEIKERIGDAYLSRLK